MNLDSDRLISRLLSIIAGTDHAWWCAGRPRLGNEDLATVHALNLLGNRIDIEKCNCHHRQALELFR